jgi:hypothetical protein
LDFEVDVAEVMRIHAPKRNQIRTAVFTCYLSNRRATAATVMLPDGKWKK